MSPESSQPSEFNVDLPVLIGDIIGDNTPQEFIAGLQQPDTAHGFVNDEHRDLQNNITVTEGSIRAIEDEIARIEQEADLGDKAVEATLHDLYRLRGLKSASVMEYSQRIETLKSA